MNAPLTSHPLPPYRHTPLFPLGKDTTTYRKITSEGVRVETILGKEVLVVSTRGDAGAVRGRVHRHQSSAAAGASAPRSSTSSRTRRRPANDKFVAYDLLKNANIAAGGVLPMCQDTGTAIIMGKKGRLRLDRRRGRGRARRGRARRVPQAQPALFAARADQHVRGEEHQVEHAGAGRDLCGGRGRLQVPVHRQGRRLGQQGVPVPGDALDPDARPHGGVPEGEDPDARHRGVPAVSPGDLHRRHLGRDDDEDRQARLDQVSRQPADARVARTATRSAISRWSRRS